MICKNCKAVIPDNVRFCPKCGVKIESETSEGVLICPKCGTSYPLTAKFCEKDGTPLQKIKRETVKTSFSNQMSLIWGLIISFILIIGLIVGYLYFSGKILKEEGLELDATFETSEELIENTQEDLNLSKEEIQTEHKKEFADFKESFEIKRVKVEKINISELEKDLNESLRKSGLSNVYAEVESDLTVTLKGTVNDPKHKILAENLIKANKFVKGIRNKINVKLLTPEELKKKICIVLEKNGLTDIKVEVNKNFEVTLSGVVKSYEDKIKAKKIAEGFKEVKRVKDMIFVVVR
ncbi:MAG: Osmotically-inducible protein OsmY [Thermodesulfobacterium sp.]|uniref:Osmotically-inducible protein OsmY n=1 Tax=Candidatus Thermodesulfobacterium syntrophicum TaxID=3060442 RepID=A0AAE3P576_9BACT|nr:Osmotically-inducible protein OsmY [Candidatus Thermodesulfobacterium syntrophicum]